MQIANLIEKIELHAAQGVDAEALVQQIINMLYKKLSEAQQILTTDRGGLL